MVSLHINTEALKPSEAFHYLGRTIDDNNRYWLEVYHNPKKARRRWGVIARVLANMGEKLRDYEMMYKAVAHYVLIYVSDSWVVTGRY